MVVLTFVRVGPCQRINICRNRVNLVQPLEAHGQGVRHPVHGEGETLPCGAHHVAPVTFLHLFHRLFHLSQGFRGKTSIILMDERINPLF